MDITSEQNKATGEVVELIAAKIGNNRAIHPATAISAGARLAGSFMFRSFNFDLKDIKPGNAVLSEQANEKGPALIGVLGAGLSNFGVELDEASMEKSSTADSTISFVDTLDILQNEAHEIMNRYGLSQEEMAFSCAIATAFIIKECQADLPAETGFHTAVYGFIEGSKTYPPDLLGPEPKKKSIFKFWQ